MFHEFILSDSTRWLRDKAKWIILPLGVALPVSYFFTIQHYASFNGSYFLDSTPSAVRHAHIIAFWLMLALGLFTIPRRYSLVAFLSLAAFIFVGMTGYP